MPPRGLPSPVSCLKCGTGVENYIRVSSGEWRCPCGNGGTITGPNESGQLDIDVTILQERTRIGQAVMQGAYRPSGGLEMILNDRAVSDARDALSRRFRRVLVLVDDGNKFVMETEINDAGNTDDFIDDAIKFLREKGK